MVDTAILQLLSHGDDWTFKATLEKILINRHCTKLKSTAAISSTADKIIQLRAKGREQEIGTSFQTYRNDRKSLLFKVKQYMRPTETAQNHEIHITHVNKKGKTLSLFLWYWYLTCSCCKKKFSATCFYLPLFNCLFGLTLR